MSIQLDLFPTIDKDLYEKIGFFSGKYQFFYHKDGYTIDLDNDANEYHGQSQNVIQLIDPNCQWHANSYDLIFKRNCVVNNTAFLFGNNGIADFDAVLGIGIMWFSKTSNQRGSIRICDLTSADGKQNIIIEGAFSPGQLKGTLVMETVIYLKSPGKNTSNCYAKTSGTILGVLDSTTIILDGNGSVFPIIEVNEQGQPLWYVVCSWSDPLVDSFDEDNVRLCINIANPAYSYLKLEDGLRDSPFLKEILAGAMHTIVMKVMLGEYWNDIVKGEGYDDGSIGQAINYFLTTFGWDTSSPERLALSIRKDFDSRI